MKDRSYDNQATLHSRDLRNNATDAERIFWTAISNRQLGGVRFNRQVPIGPFICDFVARSVKLVIELDGGQHGEAVAYDERRTEFLQARGYKVLRYWNNDVFRNLEGVVEAITHSLNLSPSRQSGRGSLPTASEGRAGGGEVQPSLHRPSPPPLRGSTPPAPAGGGK